MRPNTLVPVLLSLVSANSAAPLALEKASNFGLSMVQIVSEALPADDGFPKTKGMVNKSTLLRRQAPDMASVEQKLAAANQTLEQVEEVLHYVNDTAFDMFADALQVVTNILSTLEQAKNLAVSTKGILGDAVVKQVTKIVDSLSPYFERLSEVLTKSSAFVESTVDRLLQDFTSLVDKVLKDFEVAVQKVNGLYNQTSFLQVQEEGPLDWLLGDSNKFDHVRLAINKANNSVAQLVDELDHLNSTVVDLLVSQIIDPVESSLNQLSEFVDKAVGGILPATIGEKVKSVIDSLLSLLNQLRSKLQPVMAIIESQLEQAQALAPQLYAASDALVAMVDEAEVAASALQGTTHSSATMLQGRCAVLLIVLAATLRVPFE